MIYWFFLFSASDRLFISFSELNDPVTFLFKLLISLFFPIISSSKSAIIFSNPWILFSFSSFNLLNYLIYSSFLDKVSLYSCTYEKFAFFKEWTGDEGASCIEVLLAEKLSLFFLVFWTSSYNFFICLSFSASFL